MNKQLQAFLIGVCAVLFIAATAVDGVNNQALYQPMQTVGSNLGDADATLTPGSSAPTAIFSSALTQARTVTLSTSGAVNGTKWRIVRSGAGIGTLNVGGIITLPTLVPSWAEVTYNGSAYVLTGYGLLTP